MSATFTAAIWDKTVIPPVTKGGPYQTGFMSPAEIIIDGVQFRSFTPKSEADCAAINAAGRKLAVVPPPQIILE